MSAGALGRAVVDLDADLSLLRKGIGQAEQDVRAWVNQTQSTKPKLDIDTTKAQQSLAKIDDSAAKASTSVTKFGTSGKAAMGGFADSLAPIPLSMAGVGVGVAAATVAIGKFGVASFKAASALEENQSRVNVVFGESAAIINEFAETAASSLGLSESAALGAAGEFGNLFTAMEIGLPTATEMSTTLIQLASDLASFNNISVDEALIKLRAGLVGETEPLRTLGVNLNAATIQAKAFELGLANSTSELTPAAKAQASYALILEQTTTAQGDYERTADGAANSLRTFQASVDDLKAAIGQELTPAVAEASRELTGLTEDITTLVEVAGKLRALDDLTDGFIGKLIFGTVKGAFETAFDVTPIGRAIERLRALEDAINKVVDAYEYVPEPIRDAVDAAFDFVTGNEETARAVDHANNKVATYRASIDDAMSSVVELTAAEQDYLQTQRDLINGDFTYSTVLANLNEQQLKAKLSAEAYSASLGRQAEAAGRANERNSEYALGIQLTGGAAAQAAFVVAKLTDAQNSLAGAYQVGLQAQGAFNSQSSEYQGQISTIEAGLETWRTELEKGNITQEQFNQKQELANGVIARYEGGIADATTTAADFAIANGQIMLIQDQLAKQYPDLIQGSDAYNEKMRELATEAGVSEEAVAGVMGGSENLTGSIANELVPAILDLIRQLGDLCGIDATPEVSLDAEPFQTGVADVEGDVITLNNAAPTPTADLDTTSFDTNFSNANTGLTEFDGTVAVSDADLDTTLADSALSVLEAALAAYELLNPSTTAEADTATAETNVNNLITAMGGVPATLYTEAVFDYSAAAGAIQEYSNLHPRSPAKAGPFRTLPNWDAVYEGIPDAAAKYTEEALDHMRKYVDTANAIFDTYGAGLDLGAKLAEGFILPSGDQLATLNTATLAAVRSITDSAALFETEGLDRAKEYADAARSILDMLSSGIEAFNALATFTRPSDEAISQFKFATEHLYVSIRDSALFVGEGVAEANDYAAASSTILDMLATGLEAFALLDKFTRPSNASLSEFKFATEHLFTSIRDSALFVTEGVPEAQAYAAAANQILDTLKTGLEAFALLTDFVRPANADLSEFKFATEHLVQSMVDTALYLNADGVAAARAYAEAVQPILDLLSTGVDAFASLDDLVIGTDVEAGVRAIVALSETAVAAIIEASEGIDTDGLDAAQQYADAAGSVLGLLSSGVSGLAELGDAKFTAKVDRGLVQFLTLVDRTVRKVALAASKMDEDAIAGAQSYADAAGSVVDLLSVSAGDFDGLGEFARAVNRDMDAFVRGMELAIEKLIALEDRIGTEMLDSAVEVAQALSEIVDLLDIGGGSGSSSGSSGGSGGGGGGGFGGGGRRGRMPADTAAWQSLGSGSRAQYAALTGGAGASALYGSLSVASPTVVNEIHQHNYLDSNEISHYTAQQTMTQLSGQLSGRVRV